MTGIDGGDGGKFLLLFFFFFRLEDHLYKNMRNNTPNEMVIREEGLNKKELLYSFIGT